MSKALTTQFRIVPQFGIPESNNLPPAGPNIFVLRVVKGHAPHNAGFGTVPSPVVPIIPVELDYKPGGRDYGIGRELHGKRALPFVFNAYRVQHGVTKCLGLCHLPRLLDYLHPDKHFPASGVSVTTIQGAVSNPIVSGRAAGRGPPERVSADFARVLSLVPALVFVVAIEGAEKPFALTDSGSLHVELRAALFALPIFTSPPSSRSTLPRAPALIYVVVPVGLCAASFADESFSRCNPFALQGAEAGSSCPRTTHPEVTPANLTVLISRAGGFAFTFHRTESRFVRILTPSLK